MYSRRETNRSYPGNRSPGVSWIILALVIVTSLLYLPPIHGQLFSLNSSVSDLPPGLYQIEPDEIIKSTENALIRVEQLINNSQQPERNISRDVINQSAEQVVQPPQNRATLPLRQVNRSDFGQHIAQVEQITQRATRSNRVARHFNLEEHVRYRFDQLELSRSGRIDKRALRADVYDYFGHKTAISPRLSLNQEGGVDVELPAPRSARPGKYRVEVQHVENGETMSTVQDFWWGVLAINTHKSIYLVNETAEIGIAVLDDEGKIVCNADVELMITDPSGSVQVLSTRNGDILISPECEVYGNTVLPDYHTSYLVNGPGEYAINLTATTADGEHSIQDMFEVRTQVLFDIARAGPTRIFPPVPYDMNISIKSTEAFQGAVYEYVPADFAIEPQEGMFISRDGDQKILSWNVDLQAGEIAEISYQFDAPDISPYLFTLGPLEIGTFSEIRRWSIASDAIAAGEGGDVLLMAQGCNDMDQSSTAQTFSTACAGTYPAVCGAGAGNDRLSCDDTFVEGPTVRRNDWVGVNITAYNDTVTNCAAVTLVEICHDWVLSAAETMTNCRVGTHDGDLVWSTVSVTCPSTTPSGLVCTNVNSTEVWECDDFFGPTAVGAGGMIESFRSSGGATINVNHDVLYFQVTYDTLDESAPTYTNAFNTSPFTYSPSTNMILNITWTDQSPLNSTILESNYTGTPTNYTMNDLGGDNYDHQTIMPAGTAYWKSYANDTLSNANETPFFFFVIDQATPTLNITLNNTYANITIYEDTSLLINGSLLAGDNAPIALLQNDTILTTGASPLSITQNFPDPGIYNISVNYTHTRNYSSHHLELYVNVSDNTPPQFNLSAPQQNAILNNSDIDFVFNVSDYSLLRNCSLSVNNGGESVTANTSAIDRTAPNTIADTLSDGSYWWFIRCIDLSRNSLENTSEERNLSVDTVYPTGDYESPTPASNSRLNSSTLIVNVSHTENFPAVIQLYINDTLNQTINYTTGFTNFSVPVEDGSYNFSVFFNDTAQNFLWLEERVVDIETVRPLVELVDNTPINYTNQSSTDLVINATHTESNPDRLILYINDAINETRSYVTGDTNFTFSQLEEGAYYYSVRANDTFGNINETERRVITIDAQAPPLSLSGPDNDTWLTTNVVNFTFLTNDSLTGVDTCALYINDEFNRTHFNPSTTQEENFTLTLDNSIGYTWNINCTDYVPNTNISENRVVKIDTTFPQIQHEAVNVTLNVSVQRFTCINATVTDTFSEPLTILAEVNYPQSGLTNISLVNTTAGCGNPGGDVYSFQVLNNEEGNYTWNTTHIFDAAGNYNLTHPTTIVNWTAITQIFLEANVTVPATNITINESNEFLNYTFDHTCLVTCTDESTSACENVWLIPQFDNGSWYDYDTDQGQLIANATSHSCGNIGVQNNCNATFGVVTSLGSAPGSYGLRCEANSTNAALVASVGVNLTVNDPPVAQFTSPTLLQNISGNFTLDGSASTDDRGIARYAFSVDNTTSFASPAIICDASEPQCEFNTTSQIKCPENTFSCYLLLNITDSEGLSNVTVINVQIDNTRPVVLLDSPPDLDFRSTSVVTFGYTPIDDTLSTCTLFNNGTGTFASNSSDNTVSNNTAESLQAEFEDGSYVWNVRCTDTAGNNAFNLTNQSIFVDTTTPLISYEIDTIANNSYLNQDWIFVNVSIQDDYFENITFYLHNSTHRINSSFFSSTTSSLNFTSLTDTNEVYYFNVTVRDRAGNINSSVTRTVTLDSTFPLIEYGIGTESDNTFVNRDWIFINVSVTELNFDNITFFLYNSSYHLLNATNFSTETFSVNYTSLADTNEIYYYNVTVIDRAANINSTATNTITLDSIDPVVLLGSPVNGFFVPYNSIEFNYTPQDTNLDTCYLYANFTGNWIVERTNTSAASGILNSFPPETPADGSYVWNVQCADEAGNIGINLTNRTLNIDTTPPTGFDIELPANATESFNLTPFLNWTIPTEYYFTNYTIRFDEDPNFESPDFVFYNIGDINNNSFYMQDSGQQLVGNVRYYWQVTAYDNFSFSRNSSPYLYVTDTLAPNVLLNAPPHNDVETGNSLIQFQHNTTDANTITSCTLQLDNVTVDTDNDVTNGSTETFLQGLANDVYNWTVTCSDQAGNSFRSEVRNLTVAVPIPEVTWFQSYPGNANNIFLNRTTDGTASQTDAGLQCSRGTPPTEVFSATTDDGVGGNGFLIKANQVVNFSGEFNLGRPWWATWRLYYNNGSGFQLFIQDGDDSSTAGTGGTSGQLSVNSVRNTTPEDVYLSPSNSLQLRATLFYSTGGDPQNCASFFDNTESLVVIPGFPLGFLDVNLTDPLTDPQPAEATTFNATCIATCQQGYCLQTDVHIQTRNTTSDWQDIDVNTPLTLTSGFNPQSIGNLNSTQVVSFNLTANSISRHNEIRCIATSDYSLSNGTNTTNITVVDITVPTVELEAPHNDSYHNSTTINLTYTPNDNHLLANCSLAIDGVFDQLNQTALVPNTVNSFSASFTEGIHYWNITCADDFNNINSSITRQITIDLTPPIVTLDGPPNASIQTSPLSFNYTGTDTYLASCTLYQNASGVFEANKTNSTPVSGAPSNFSLDLEHLNLVWNVRCADLANNTAFNLTNFTVTNDIQPPDLTLSSPGIDDNITLTTLNITWTAVDNAITTCNLTIDGVFNGTGIPASDGSLYNRTLEDIVDGGHLWNITCIDQFGFTTTSSSRNVTMMRGPAILNITLNADGSQLNITWTRKEYADEYYILTRDRYEDTPVSTPLATTQSDNYTDNTVISATSRFYSIATARANTNVTTFEVGKFNVTLPYNTGAANDFHLVSLPLGLFNYELNNGTNNGYNIPGTALDCVETIWRYNGTDMFDRTDNVDGVWLPGMGTENFTHLQPGVGYWFETNGSCIAVFAGVVPSRNVSESLAAEWNIIGWNSPNQTDLPIDDAPPYPIDVNPAGIVQAIDRYNSSTNRFEVTIFFPGYGWFPSFNNPNFTKLDPNVGYYFDTSQTGTWLHDPNT